MRVARNLSEVDFNKESVVTVGTFDGVHLGHRQIIEKLDSIKSLKSYRSIVITFEPHPQIVLKNRTHDVKILTTLDEKLELFENLGIDLAFVINFTNEFAKTPAEDFYKKYLIDGTGLSDLVLGYDHMFGKNREGNFDKLEKLSVKYGFCIDKIDEYKHGGEHISSTVIRRLLEESGDIKKAGQMLGGNYGFEGTVVEGRKLGREIGYPTANIGVSSEYKLIPKIGVYTVKAEVEGKSYHGMMSIGKNPTVTDDDSIKIEVNVFDFKDELYGKKIRISLVEYLRDEVKFNSLEELKNMLKKDKEESLKIVFNKK